ncbi:MAG: family 20 glycosylhydrolase, partial [bacterium]
QKPGEKATYGGFYTQDDIREIVNYASERFINVIPEIEMPAHSVEVLAAYPALSCTGGPFTVPPGSYWPNTDILCAGNDSVFTFLQDVLTEVMDLFPSKYIHVGGDEADKTNWKKCAKCQARIKAEALKDEKELQSYFIRRMEKFIVSRGRKLIGWDEILEGGLAPEATVMSWRGVEGGIEAARQGHDVIMTPTSYCYFDYYQADPQWEPKAIGGLLTLKKVYSFEPSPEELTPEQQKYILGAQGNVWTEFITTIAQAEYMAVPRMLALSEVVWTPKKERNWDDFRLRLKEQFKRLDILRVNYSKGSFRANVSTSYDEATGKMKMILSSEQPDVPILYTLSGNDPKPDSPVYTEPFEINTNCYLKAGLYVDGKLKEKLLEMPVMFHHAIGKKLTYLTDYSYRYPASGKGSLNDGLRGSVNHRDGFWQGYLGNDLEVIIDLGKEMPVVSVQMNYLQNQKSWIFLPSLVEYSLSPDGKKWHSINEVLTPVKGKSDQVVIHPFNFMFREGTTARYVKIKAKNTGKCPPWHDGAGEPCWIFTDEIVVF